ncbi:hypothetical protein A9Q84_19140 [Halobacteriovorax marinus]|uniref:Chemotaxis phosphatase CheX-like domain-containing protein n=1 Tax=Halobacteriovorax marinus TaxID=97084 RepID=A0A1Y5F2C0_9BACT|nr:hypothetical protein A9Q84_19140 [Halobacteriovorax marinus]
MINFGDFSKIVEKECSVAVKDFLDSVHEIKISKLNDQVVYDDICGPSVEVSGEKLNYTCVLQYNVEDNIKYLDLLTKKYPFVDNGELPELDIMDLLGEFLNILCGKINYQLEKEDSHLNIEIPYFSYGVQLEEGQTLGVLKCNFGDLSFKLHYLLN